MSIFGPATNLADLFRDEAQESLKVLVAGAMDVERGAVSPQLFGAMFRGAHTIKGGARLLGLVEIANATEALEHHIKEIRDLKTLANGLLAASLMNEIDQIDHLIQTFDIDASRTIAGTSQRESSSFEIPPGHTMPEAGEIRVGPPPSDTMDNSRSRANSVVARNDRPRSAPLETSSSVEEDNLPPTSQAQARGDTTVRVRTERIDQLVGLVSEARRLALSINSKSTRAVANDDLLDILGAAEAAALRLRLVPFGGMFDNLRRAVRDSARDDGKEAELSTVGGDVEADASIVDSASEIVLQLVRNAVAHGLESTSTRLQSGKPRVGTVRVEIRARGRWLGVSVSDDGRGIDEAAVRQRALSQGLDPRSSIRQLIFSAGLSTRQTIDSLGGQGIGLDIVDDRCRAMGAEVEVDWISGQGTTFSVRLPVSAIFERLVVGAIDERLVGIQADLVEFMEPVDTFDQHLFPGSATDDAITPEWVALDGFPDEINVLTRPLGPLFAGTSVARRAWIADDGRIGLVLDLGQED